MQNKESYTPQEVAETAMHYVFCRRLKESARDHSQLAFADQQFNEIPEKIRKYLKLDELI